MPWYIEALKTTPALGVLAYIVFQHARDRERASARFLAHLEKRDEVLSVISGECHNQQALASEAIRENTRALGQMAEVLRSFHKAS